MSTRKTTIATPIRRSSAAKGRKGHMRTRPASSVLKYRSAIHMIFVPWGFAPPGRQGSRRSRPSAAAMQATVFRIIRWPKPGPASQHGKTKHDCLGRKDADEYLEKARYRLSNGRSWRRRADDTAEQCALEIQLPRRLQQRENAEQYKSDTQRFHGLFQSPSPRPSIIVEHYVLAITLVFRP